MHSQTVVILLIVFTISLLSMVINGKDTPPICEPGILEEMPQHIKKVCVALENSNQLSSALNAYIRNEAAALLYKSDDFVAPGAGKRTDVDHVFLRFGRRRRR